MRELIHCIFNMRWFRKVATVINVDEIRTAQCIQRSVIRQWFGFLAVKNLFTEFHIWRGLAELLESKLV